MTSDPLLAVSSSGLTKRFRGGQVAVDHIDLEVVAGSVYGFLGPNGSGKTTTIRMLLGLIRPTSGTHGLLGKSMPERAGEVLPHIGSLVEGPAFHPYLSGWANLARLDAADRHADVGTANARIGAALDRVGLTAAAGKRYRNYSLGMRQRLGICAALLQPRRLLILDEPTNGLDPQGTREVRSLVTDLAASGVTVLLSTHLLAEVEQICSHVGVMHRGRLVAQSSLTELRSGTAPRVHVDTADQGLAKKCLVRLGLSDPVVDETGISAGLGSTDPAAIVSALVHDGVQVRAFGVQAPDLEDLFVGLTGEGFDVSG
ncbi:MAG: ABC transporter ATP-binding protein [Geodermatophilaceae bacterium]|nr:ABC transporter ATP-binding protein [Geodermatophilaceae bacterium]